MKSSKEEARSFGALYLGEEHNIYKKGDSRPWSQGGSARPVIDSLNALCLNPSSEVPVEALVEVLYHAAVLFWAPETSADAMTSTARLLKVGMMRAFSLNRDVCVVKLPSVFTYSKFEKIKIYWNAKPLK
ncbi:hypothetical protein YC2023_020074 [Brassica napus]